MKRGQLQEDFASACVGISLVGHVRRFLEKFLPARVRFRVFQAAAFFVPSHVGSSGFQRLAAELDEAGRMCEALRCWRIVHGMAPTDARIGAGRVSCAIRAGDFAEVERALDDLAHGSGVPPHTLVGIAGQLAQRGHIQGAGRMLLRLADLSGGDRLIAQSPSLVSERLPGEIRSLGKEITFSGMDANALLALARLCFTFRNASVAAALYSQASEIVSLEALDRVAMLHSIAEADPGATQGIGEELCELVDELSSNPEASGSLVKVALVAGEMEIARKALRGALYARHGEGGRMVSKDCEAILEVLAALYGVAPELPQMLRKGTHRGEGGVPKVFLCGFGWSGSGALYDEIRGVPAFCEFEGAGLDPIINEDADSEVTFVQGSGGLGDLWLRAVRDGSISWHALWDTFNLHVAGLSPIGYAQYKCAAAARNHVQRYGGEYTYPFRRFLEEYARIRREPQPGALHACLLEVTESLCSMLVRRTGARIVLFNNAIFGRDAAMLEIFRSRRAAIVYRDPRDVYVDRRKKDLNHWRTPAQLAVFYAYGLQQYMAYKVHRGADDLNLREVSFERFVMNDRFRARVREWLLGEVPGMPGARHFDSFVSRRNIGIHVGAVTRDEHTQLQGGLELCRKLDRISDEAWGAGG